MSERQRSFQAPITYFYEEGKANLEECMKLSFEASLAHDIKKLVIFTAVGEGVKLAIEEYLGLAEYSETQVIAVSFSNGRVPVNISAEDEDLFRSKGISIVRAHMPFNPILGTFQERGVAQGLSLLASVLETFCGSMSLCVQAVLMACDAGHVEPGEHVIALTSDTSVLVRACPTTYFLSDFIIREVLCKPVLLTIGKREGQPENDEEEDSSSRIAEAAANTEPKILPPGC